MKAVTTKQQCHTAGTHPHCQGCHNRRTPCCCRQCTPPPPHTPRLETALGHENGAGELAATTNGNRQPQHTPRHSMAHHRHTHRPSVSVSHKHPHTGPQQQQPNSSRPMLARPATARLLLLLRVSVHCLDAAATPSPFSCLSHSFSSPSSSCCCHGLIATPASYRPLVLALLLLPRPPP